MSVAVIDIGSNSIKLLVAACDERGQLAALHARTVDARISAGISQSHPHLGEAGMATGLAAVRELLAEAAPLAPVQTILVATSAVRDAVNGAEFRACVHAATGHDIRILSGDEEADLIGAGLVCDPALADLRDFYVFDLGGGSLECLSFRDRRIAQEASLPLGCVRLMEKFVPDPASSFPDDTRQAVAGYVRQALAASKFHFGPAGGPAVFAGGSMTTVRAIFAAQAGKDIHETRSIVTITELRTLLDRLAPLSLKERHKIPGLPARRADVFPTALATILAVAESAKLAEFQHSFYNLRWGVAAKALGKV
ncbi:MAG TPA: phosphatase [Opitutaceae bacterium]|jgi:exopolyphosphatase/guanosine-5'-triphosphate,3'-diphosphate pyrophosphatase|nr:phosphatase [Opitutaceae bacterium]